jgi:Cu(I)/Ag(I) efflux system membrane protein CusA/SilA
MRYPREIRDSLQALKVLPIVTSFGATIPLGEVAKIEISEGPDTIKSENGRLNGWIFVDIADRDLASYVKEAQKKVKQIELPPGYSLLWSGQYEYLERALARLGIVAPFTLAIIILLLYLNFRRFSEVVLILLAVPFALVGGIWFLYLIGYHLSVAVGVGFIALLGIAVEIMVVKLIYLHHALAKRLTLVHQTQRSMKIEDIKTAIVEGALLRLRPIMMTSLVIIGGLLPIMLFGGTGSEVMRRIAAPIIGGMITATLLALIVLPAIYLLWQSSVLLTKKGN